MMSKKRALLLLVVGLLLVSHTFAAITITNSTVGSRSIVKYTCSGLAACGNSTWTAPAGVTAIDILIVGGGGAGGAGDAGRGCGATSSNYGAGGGAGALLNGTSISVSEGGTYNITVGDGGQCYGHNGGFSAFNSMVAPGGGYGGQAATQSNGSLGGSGGGAGPIVGQRLAGLSNATVSNGSAIAFGFRGGYAVTTDPSSGAGGGGAGGLGTNGTNTGGAQGGLCLQNNITGTPTNYSAGGGGNFGATKGIGGCPDTGGNSSTTSANPEDGALHTGSGGGGSWSVSRTQAFGGTGIVIISYALPDYPTASFTANVTSGGAPVPVMFNDTSIGGAPTAWVWNFTNVTGNNTAVTFSTSKNVTYTFGVGNWSIKLNASNAAGNNISTQTTFINVTVPISADFSANITLGTPPLSVEFTDTSAGSPTSWQWSFGDITSLFSTWSTKNTGPGIITRNYGRATRNSQGYILFAGGYADMGSGVHSAKNDSWRSTDNGSTWSQITTSNAWVARDGFAFGMQPTTGYIYVISGFARDNPVGTGGNTVGDVWRSTDNGVSYSRINASAFPARYQAGYAFLPNGNIVIFGGEAIYASDSNLLNDTWMSSDNGVTWTQMNSSSGWAKRSRLTNAAMQDNSILLTGGWIGGGATTNRTNESWRSTDYGATWTRVNASSGWVGRIEHVFESFVDGSAVISQGGNNSANAVDSWRTVDNGVTWSRINATSGFDGLNGAASATTVDGKMLVISGYALTSHSYEDNVYEFTPSSVSTSAIQNPTHVFTTIGNYTVWLNASNSVMSDNETKVGYINVTDSAEPTAAFSSNTNSGLSPLQVTFSDGSLGVPTAWVWNFTNVTGNNTAVTFSTSQNPTYTFGVGNWSIKLNVSNVFGNNISASTYFVNVSPPVVAAFAANNTYGTPPLSIQFYDGSTGTPTSWSWLFGDGTGMGNYSNATWVAQNTSAGWQARKFEGLVTTEENHVILFGGYVGGSPGRKNDVWRSNNSGVTWTQINSSPGWTARYGHMVTKLSDDTIIMAGGYDGSLKNDVWKSEDEGLTWTRINSSAGWSPRGWSGFVTMPNGDILLVGGNGGNEDSPVYQDVWKSTDNGVTWVLVNTTMQLGVRTMMGCSVLPNGYVILSGGWGDTGGGDVYSDRHNDTWLSTNEGVTFTLMNASSGYMPRVQSDMVGLDDYSVVISGGTDNMVYRVLSDTWRSTDYGATWTRINQTAPWEGRNGLKLAVLNDSSIIMAGGYSDNGYATYHNDVYRLTSITSSGSTEQNPIHTYVNVGNYTVSLLSWNTLSSNTSVRVGYINVSNSTLSPVSNFSVNVTNGLSPLTVQFTDDSSNVPTGFIWNFTNVTGNNTPVTFATTQHTIYAFGVGNWSINLNVSNAGGSNISAQTTFINVSTTPPVASFTANQSSGTAPLQVRFTDTSTNTPTMWHWYYKNVTGENVWVGFSTSQNPTQSFGVGNYTIRLNATNAGGSNATVASVLINVSAGLSAPVSTYTKNTTGGVEPISVAFTDTSTNTPTSWSWTFRNISGNNTRVQFSTSQNPGYTFGVGNWSIVLNATNSIGTSSSEQSFVNVTKLVVAPVSSFGVSESTGTYPLMVTFTDTSTNTPTAWVWNFTNVTGNNTPVTFSTSQNPTYTFGIGNWSIRLNTSNSAGNNVSAQVSFVNVSGTPPTAYFTANRTNGMVPLPVAFTDESGGYPTSWNWSFGDGVYSGDQNPTHTYSSVSNFTVILTVTNSYGTSIKSSYITTYADSAVIITSALTNSSGFGCVQFTGYSNGTLPKVWFEYGANANADDSGNWYPAMRAKEHNYANGTFTDRVCGAPFIPGYTYKVRAAGGTGNLYTSVYHSSTATFTMPTQSEIAQTTYSAMSDQLFTDMETGDPADIVHMVSEDVWAPYILALGSMGLFFGLMIAFVFFNMGVKQGALGVVIILSLILYSYISGIVPAEFTTIMVTFGAIIVGGLFYWMIRRR